MKSLFLNDLEKRLCIGFGLYFLNTKEEKEYIRNNNCTYRVKIIHGGKIAILRDKNTNEVLTVPIYENY